MYRVCNLYSIFYYMESKNRRGRENCVNFDILFSVYKLASYLSINKWSDYKIDSVYVNIFRDKYHL